MAQPLVNMNPNTLYEQCVSCFVANLNYSVISLERVQQLRYLPPGILIDVYELMSRREDLKDALLEQLCDLEIFWRLLRFNQARSQLLHIIASLMSSKKPLPSMLADNYILRYDLSTHHTDQSTTSRQTHMLSTASKLSTLAKAKLQQDKYLAQNHQNQQALSIDNAYSAAVATTSTTITTTANLRRTNSKTITPTTTETDADADIIAQADKVAENELNSDTSISVDPIEFGLRLGSFLSEAGWLPESIEVLRCVADRLKRLTPDINTLLVRLDCLQRLLHSEAALSNFKSSERTFDQIVELHKAIAPEHMPSSLLANTFTQISAMYFARNDYDDSHMWSMLAMRQLETKTPERIAVDVLRQAAKSCVVKRDFARANMLICQATRRARETFGPKHQKYGDALLDYGFFLLNVDSIYQSVNVYKEALDIKRGIFGNRNFHVAIAHEDLSYAYYVHEYSTGDFTCAQDHVDKAVDIMKDLVPSDHLMLASAKRVKALLLEEIALDKMADGIDEEGLLVQSEDLHKFALNLSLEVFGESNVQTAKHYGNLGRLYQTMNRFEEAERMHQKAIKIKTTLLGPYDYEVGLSIGHLASLYNYQMKKYRQAEDLYLRSIDISLRLFGRSYSGLEYDYLGLCHVYEKLNEFEKYLRYAHILENWQMLRGQNISMNKSTYPAIIDDCSLEDVKNKYFNMCTTNLNIFIRNAQK